MEKFRFERPSLERKNEIIEYLDEFKEYGSNINGSGSLDKIYEGYSFEDFCNDEKTIDATVFAISQIGELVKNISQETIKKYSNIERNMIKSLRNRIVHDYEGINLKNIWVVLKYDVLDLKNSLLEIIDNYDEH